MMVREGKESLEVVSLDISPGAGQGGEGISDLLGHPRALLLLQLLAVEPVILAQLVDDTDHLVTQPGVASLQGRAHNRQHFPPVVTSRSSGVGLHELEGSLGRAIHFWIF